VNILVAASSGRELGGRRRYEYIFAGPQCHGLLARTAAEVVRERFGGPLKEFATSPC
jgi:hypothetical protein